MFSRPAGWGTSEILAASLSHFLRGLGELDEKAEYSMSSQTCLWDFGRRKKERIVGRKGGIGKGSEMRGQIIRKP